MKKTLFWNLLANPESLFIALLFLSACNGEEGEKSQPAPEVTNVAPGSGAKGTEVIITGKNFSTTLSENVVTFNNTTAEVSAATATRLTVEVPAGAGSGEISVTSKSKTASNKPVFGYEWLVTTVAGGEEGSEDGAADQAKFSALTGITLDGQGNIYVSDAGLNNTIRKISSGVVSTLAGSTVGFKDGTGAEAQLHAPIKIDLDAQGNLFVADWGNARVRRITPGGVVSTFAGSTNGYEDNVGVLAKFGLIYGLCVDAAGNIYVTDPTYDNIRKITPDGTVTTVAGNGEGFLDGEASTAKFKNPRAIAAAPDGTLYVSDTENYRVRKISTDGMVSTVVGTTSGFADGPVASAQFGGTGGLCIDAQGNIYIADVSNNRIRLISPDGVVTTLAGSIQGGVSFGAADGSALQAQFNSPTDIALDVAGNLYVTDSGNDRVRKIEY
jgi:sugar lactone lactonase YvrE